MFTWLFTEWRAVSAILGLAAFFAWESFAPFFEQRRKALHATRNLTVAGVNAVLVGVCCAGATVWIAEWTEAQRLGLLHLFDLSAPAQFAIGFLILDFWTYWWHRANHRLPLLWRFHRMHHSDASVDVSTALRFHGGELLLSAALRLALIPLAGLSLTTVLVYAGAVVVATEFHHANIGLPDGLDRFVRLAIVSPNMHKVHHSRLREETNSNYATVFSWWDRLFTTYRKRRDYRGIRFGLDGFDDDRFQTLGGLALTPFRSERRP